MFSEASGARFFFAETFQSCFAGIFWSLRDISFICFKVVLKLTEKVFISLIFFSHFKSILVFD